uniref:ORF69 n=1 Tax=Cynomys herpesvirus TaxID=550803 RepID=B5ANH8_9GAMA|nr:ORF69 [Cynomys herpesvirus]
MGKHSVQKHGVNTDPTKGPHVSKPHKTRSICSKMSRASKLLKNKMLLSDRDFFSAISIRKDIGSDFLREMDSPICTSKTLLLPLSADQIAPGRCLFLSAFGHTSNLGFHCDICNSAETRRTTDVSPRDETVSTRPGDLLSVNLTFYHNADKVVHHKFFYLSLLSNSLDAVKQSFQQPGLLYAYVIFRSFSMSPFPIFTNHEGLMTMWLIFRQRDLHISENCLRLLVDNLPMYKIEIDCIRKDYIISFSPLVPEENRVSIPEASICEAITTLDFTDECKENFVYCNSLIMSNK